MSALSKLNTTSRPGPWGAGCGPGGCGGGCPGAPFSGLCAWRRRTAGPRSWGELGGDGADGGWLSGGASGEVEPTGGGGAGGGTGPGAAGGGCGALSGLAGSAPGVLGAALDSGAGATLTLNSEGSGGFLVTVALQAANGSTRSACASAVSFRNPGSQVTATVVDSEAVVQRGDAGLPAASREAAGQQEESRRATPEPQAADPPAAPAPPRAVRRRVWVSMGRGA